MSSVDTCYITSHLIQAVGKGNWGTVIISPSQVHPIQLMAKLGDPVLHQGAVCCPLKFSVDRFFVIVPVSINNCLLSSGNIMKIQLHFNDWGNLSSRLGIT